MQHPEMNDHDMTAYYAGAMAGSIETLEEIIERCEAKHKSYKTEVNKSLETLRIFYAMSKMPAENQDKFIGLVDKIISDAKKPGV